MCETASLDGAEAGHAFCRSAIMFDVDIFYRDTPVDEAESKNVKLVAILGVSARKWICTKRV